MYLLLLERTPSMDLYGFILTRHVNSEKTNKYWNHSVQCIRQFYPDKKIVVIDDNSNPQYVKADHDYKNVQIIPSEYPGRGELLPYYYFYKYRFFKNAVILHDSVFFHKRIQFEKLRGVKVLPFWHFNRDQEEIPRTLHLTNILNQHKYTIQKKVTLDDNVLGMNYDKWYGCFGVQSYIQLDFLTFLAKKYDLFQLVKVVKCRLDRCCLERIFGILFTTEYPFLLNQKSLLGDIFGYQNWGYSYDEYEKDLKKKRIPQYLVKIWTGR
jgi:hypothetical protein